ncbi:MAG: hypothetical protein OXE99_05555 [Cellvibrionales bacterium]|nr:hypothetical protein [Cellvibrionales bacterium]
MKKLLVPVIAGSLLTGCVDELLDFFELPVEEEVVDQTPKNRYDINYYEQFKSTDLDNLEGNWVLINKDLQGENVVVDPEADISAKMVVDGNGLALFTLSDNENDGDASIKLPNAGYRSDKGALLTLTESDGIYTSEDGTLTLTLVDNGRLTGTYELTDDVDDASGAYSASAKVELVKINDSIALEGTLNLSSDDGVSIDHTVEFLTDMQGAITLSKVTEGEEDILFQDDDIRTIAVSDNGFSYFASFSSTDAETIVIENEAGTASLTIIPSDGIEYTSDALTYKDQVNTVVANSESYGFDSVSVSFSATDVTEPETPVDFSMTLDASW